MFSCRCVFWPFAFHIVHSMFHFFVVSNVWIFSLFVVRCVFCGSVVFCVLFIWFSILFQRFCFALHVSFIYCFPRFVCSVVSHDRSSKSVLRVMCWCVWFWFGWMCFLKRAFERLFGREGGRRDFVFFLGCLILLHALNYFRLSLCSVRRVFEILRGRRVGRSFVFVSFPFFCLFCFCFGFCLGRRVVG